jgi:hypothetical protein
MTTFAELPAKLREIASRQIPASDHKALNDAAQTVQSVLDALAEFAKDHPSFHEVYLLRIP